MTFRINAPIDSNQHKGLLGVNSSNGKPLAITGLSLTNAQPAHVAIVDTSGNQLTSFGLAPQTSGGLTSYHLASANSTNATVVKASAGQLYGYMVSNTSAAYTYLCFHDTASTPTAGASILFKIGIPTGGAANVSFDAGIQFASGIAITTVTGAADNNTTAVAANDQVINLWFK